jgi:type IV pilus assembly protein PilP
MRSPMNRVSSRIALRLLAVMFACAAAALTACSSADDELQRFIDETKHEPGGRVEPLPEIKPYETFVYAAGDMRSPFMPSSPGSGAGIAGIRPDQKRNREFLEQYSLDTLKMVGTLRLGGQMYGLVETKDHLVHRVTAGNYMGQAEGRITEITPSKISLVEIVPDSLGGYMERPAALGLNE